MLLQVGRAPLRGAVVVRWRMGPSWLRFGWTAEVPAAQARAIADSLSKQADRVDAL